MHNRWIGLSGLLQFFACAAFAMLLGAGASAAAAATDRCTARVELKLTPDVPNPRDPMFLNALTANPLYELKWIEGSDSSVVLELTGPASDYRCESEIKRMSRDAHVMDLKVLEPDSQEAHS